MPIGMPARGGGERTASGEACRRQARAAAACWGGGVVAFTS
jgi:hypothetical protein